MSPEQLKQITSQLKGIHTPDDISWFPFSFGWWLLIIFCLVSAIILVMIFINNKKVNQQIDELLLLPKLNRPLAIIKLLKASAMHKDPIKNNRLQGVHWLQWFQQYCHPISPEWNLWLSHDYLLNQIPPKDWPKTLKIWLKQLK